MRMAIEGIGVCGGFGSGVNTLRQALQTGEAAPQRITLEQHDNASFPAYRTDVSGLEEFFPKRTLRRIDHFARMTLFGASLALQDAGQLAADRSRTGVVIASGYGALQTTFNFLDSYLDFGYACSSPTHFSNSVHNAAAAQVAMQFKATAPNLTVTQFEMSAPSALLTAQLWLAEGRVDQVLLGAVDEYCDVLRYCRDQFFGATEQGPLRPLEFDRQSAVVGEGAAFFVLTRAEQAAAYACIDSVYLGNHRVRPVALPQEDLLLIGADGHRLSGQFYAQALAGRAALAYAPLYGSFPAAAGFDLAVAALCLKEQQIFPQPVTTPGPTPEQGSENTLHGISCLKFSAAAEYGLVRLVR